MSGKIVKKGTLSSGSQILDVSDLPKGNFVIKCIGTTKEDIRQFVRI